MQVNEWALLGVDDGRLLVEFSTNMGEVRLAFAAHVGVEAFQELLDVSKTVAGVPRD